MKKAADHRDPPTENAAGGPPPPCGADSLSPDGPDSPDTHTTERWTVDGIEDSPHGPQARLERGDGTTFDLPLRLLPESLREGDVLAVQDGPDGVTVRILVAETLERRETAQARLDALNSAESGLQDEDGEITV